MPFNNHGLFNRIYDWKKDRDNGVNILAERMDNETNSIVAAINAILQGRFKFLGPIKNLFGTHNRPSVTFADDEDTGIYRVSENTLGITAGGLKKIEVGNDTTKILGNLEVSWDNVNDGGGSNLDADKLDGEEGSFYQNAGNINDGILGSDRLSGSYDITAADATLLNGNNESFYRNADNINNGTLHSDRLSGNYNITASNATNAANATNATTATNAHNADNATRLNGKAASDYLNASNIRTGSLPRNQLSGTYNININGDISKPNGRLGQYPQYVSNLNGVIYNGWYYATSSATGKPPKNGTFIFESVFYNSREGRQRGHYIEEQAEYQRFKKNNVWENWQRIYTRTTSPDVQHTSTNSIDTINFNSGLQEVEVPNLKATIRTSKPNSKVKIEVNINIGVTNKCGVFIKRKIGNEYVDVRPALGAMRSYCVSDDTISSAVNNISILEINNTSLEAEYEYSVWVIGDSGYIRVNSNRYGSDIYRCVSTITLTEI